MQGSVVQTTLAREERPRISSTTPLSARCRRAGGSTKMPTLRVIAAPTSPRDRVRAYCYPGSRTGSSELNFLTSETGLSYAYSFDSKDFKGVSPGASNG